MDLWVDLLGLLLSAVSLLSASIVGVCGRGDFSNNWSLSLAIAPVVCCLLLLIMALVLLKLRGDLDKIFEVQEKRK